MKSSSKPTKCESCAHYRPQVSMVDAWKRMDVSLPRGPIMSSLKEIRKAETEALEHEVEQLFELVRAETLEWPAEPRFAPYCNWKGRVLVAALKNQGNRCTDFELAVSRDERACHTCVFVQIPMMKIGDRHESIKGYMSQGERDSVRTKNRENEDADAAALGLELEQSFYSGGLLPVVSFLQTCGAKRRGGQYHVIPACNLRSQCAEHYPHLRLPNALRAGCAHHFALGHSDPPAKPESADDVALDITLSMVDAIMRAAARHPDRCIDELVSWSSRDTSHGCAAAWLKRGLRRWKQTMRFQESHLEALPSEGAEQLLPIIAGADAFEWAWLAASSYREPERAAAVVVQQMAEFLHGTVRIADSIHAIEGVEKLWAVELFSPTTMEVLTTFRRHLESVREDLSHAVRTDLIAQYEALATELLYSVAAWLRLRPSFGAPSSLAGDVTTKTARARAEGTHLLSCLAALDDPNGSVLPAQVLEELSKRNDQALELDVEEQKRLLGGIVSSVAGSTPGTADAGSFMRLLGLPSIAAMAQDPVNSAVEQQFSAARQTLPLRRLRAWLIFRRGTLSVTPSVLDFFAGRSPAQWPPSTIQQAVSEPMVKNLEGTFPGPGVDELMARCRRFSRPCVLRSETSTKDVPASRRPATSPPPPPTPRPPPPPPRKA